MAKGAVEYDQVGNSYLYRAAVPREEMTRQEVRSVFDRVVGAAVSPVLAHFHRRGRTDGRRHSQTSEAARREAQEAAGRRQAAASREVVMSGVDGIARAWLDWTVAASWQIALLVCLIARADVRAARCVAAAAVRAVAAGAGESAAAADAGGVLGSRAAGAWRRWRNTSRQAVAAASRRASRRSMKAVSAGDRTTTAAGGILERASRRHSASQALLLAVWAAGCVALWVAVAWRYRRLVQHDTFDAANR